LATEKQLFFSQRLFFRSTILALSGTLESTMLIELWERLRGYDKWVETKAIVESADQKKTTLVNRYGNKTDKWTSDDVIVWTDAQGHKQYADFTVDEPSKLFQLIDGETVTIRYNPSRPEEFYYRDLLRYRVRRFLQITLLVLFLVAFLSFLVWLRISPGAK
jgi:hypothetical protein